MSLTPSKRFMGWTNCRITPLGGTLTPIPGLTSCQFSRNSKALLIDGDLDMYDSTGTVTKQSPTFKVSSNKPGILDSINPGPCLFYIERWDAVNGGQTGGGAVSYTVANAIFVPDDQGGGQRAEGVGSFTIHCIAADGVTNPVAVSPL